MIVGNQKGILELINKTKTGDEKAHVKLYKYYSYKLKYFLKNKYPSNYDWEDDLSEIVIKVYQNINNYDEQKSKFNTWIINIANNYMIDKSKKKIPNILSIQPQSDENFIIDDNLYIEEGSRPDMQYENSDLIFNIYSNMCSSDTRLFNMKNDGYNYNEIGSELNLTSTQVSNRFNYVKTKIKEGS